VHQDKLGQPILVGDAVVYYHGHSIEIGRVTKIGPKMVHVVDAGQSTYLKQDFKKYSRDLVVLEGAAVTEYLLKLAA
jgi:hypothetical protein